MVSHRESNLRAIDQQANDTVMQLDRLGKQMVLCTRRVMRVRTVTCFRSFCWVFPLPGHGYRELDAGSTPPRISEKAGDPKGLQEGFQR
jgi:hypothetical protein